METNRLVQPFLKWAGGKRQIFSTIKEHLPKQFNSYYEPFAGAGAVLFGIQPATAVINDINFELINCYRVVRESLAELLNDLAKHQNEEDYYYAIRDLDLKDEFKDLSRVQRASRIIYLNKTCYNGLFRVNSDGHFNVPFGRYKNPKVIDEKVLRAVHSYLNQSRINILNTDFEEVALQARKNDFIYFDPPYDPLSDTASFTGYNLNGFGKDDQKRLRSVFARLARRGCFVLLSNSPTDFILDLYRDFKIIRVPANRNINSVGSGRGKIDEVLVMSY